MDDILKLAKDYSKKRHLDLLPHGNNNILENLESETISAAFFSSPGAERQKGGQNAYIEKGQRTGRTSLYCGLYAYLRCQ